MYEIDIRVSKYVCMYAATLASGGAFILGIATIPQEHNNIIRLNVQ